MGLFSISKSSQFTASPSHFIYRMLNCSIFQWHSFSFARTHCRPRCTCEVNLSVRNIPLLILFPNSEENSR